MLEHIHYWVMYIGSAAVTAFLAACLSSPQLATFTCPVNDGGGGTSCELTATLAATVPEAGGMNPEILAAMRHTLDTSAAPAAATPVETASLASGE